MKNKILYACLIAILFLLTNYTTAQQTTLTNIYFEASENEVIIQYDLSGDKEDEYEVEVFLKSEMDPFFRVKPTHVTGDIGKGYFVGKERKVVWQYTRDFAAPLEGSDFYFEVNATKLGGVPWYYYVGGTALAGGLAAILLIKKTDETTKTPIKEPPDRP